MTDVDGPNNITLKEADRPLLVINDFAVWGSTRVQKYGFLLRQLHGKEMTTIHEIYGIKFYDDWKAFWYGPYSYNLHQDLETCIANGSVVKLNLAKMDREKKHVFQLTPRGRLRWRQLFMSIPEIPIIVKTIGEYQKIPYYTLLNRVYSGWPEFAKRSRIRKDVAAMSDR